MIDKIKEITNKKLFHVAIISVIILTLLLILIATVLNYDENGEKNLPFNISKISIISTSEGIDKTSETENKWAFDINQNNDIYIYLEKNDNYGKKETIKSVLLDNFSVNNVKKTGEIKIYRPDANAENQIFTAKEENVESAIEFIGGTESKFKDLKILNQGDIFAFRCSNEKIATYESNEDVEINHGELLKKVGMKLEKISGTLTFDMTINLNSGKSFKANLSINIPAGDIVENATANTEITDFSNVVFKRIKN